MFVKSEAKMTSSAFMPPTLAIIFHYPNSWHNTTVKSWSPLILLLQIPPLSQLQVVTHSIQFVLITQWQLSAINASTSPH